MTTSTSQERWLDFSGAPPMLIPWSLAEYWRGTTDPATGKYREFDKDNPVTDYDRASAAAWPGRSILEFRGVPILILYTENDQHGWDARRQILACGGWFSSQDEVRRATWTDPIRWRSEHTDNSFTAPLLRHSSELLSHKLVDWTSLVNTIAHRSRRIVCIRLATNRRIADGLPDRNPRFGIRRDDHEPQRTRTLRPDRGRSWSEGQRLYRPRRSVPGDGETG